MRFDNPTGRAFQTRFKCYKFVVWNMTIRVSSLITSAEKRV